MGLAGLLDLVREQLEVGERRVVCGNGLKNNQCDVHTAECIINFSVANDGLDCLHLANVSTNIFLSIFESQLF